MRVGSFRSFPCFVEPGDAGAVERPGMVGRRGASPVAAAHAVISADEVAVVVVAAAAAVAITNIGAPGIVKSGAASAKG